MSSAAERGGVSRPSVKAWTTVFTPASCRIFASATACSWCECTPPGDIRPIRWQVPPDALQLRDQVGERRRAGEAAVLGGLADARQFLHHHAAGADVQVADLGIAHLAVRQADIAAGGAQEGVRAGLPEPVEVRLARLADGVVGGFLAPAQAVEDHQHHRPNRLRHGSAPFASGHWVAPATVPNKVRAVRHAMPFTMMSFASCARPVTASLRSPKKRSEPWQSSPSPMAITPSRRIWSWMERPG